MFGLSRKFLGNTPKMAQPPLNTMEGFLRLPLVASKLEEDAYGNLVRVEVRKCETTGVTLRGRFKVPDKPHDKRS